MTSKDDVAGGGEVPNGIHQGKPTAAKTSNHVLRHSCVKARAAGTGRARSRGGSSAHTQSAAWGWPHQVHPRPPVRAGISCAVMACRAVAE